jgi:hypothetical protein
VADVLDAGNDGAVDGRVKRLFDPDGCGSNRTFDERAGSTSEVFTCDADGYGKTGVVDGETPITADSFLRCDSIPATSTARGGRRSSKRSTSRSTLKSGASFSSENSEP